MNGTRTEERVLHLSETQMDEALMGGMAELDEQVRAHLGECVACQDSLAAMADAIGGFCEVSLLWSERTSSTMPTPIVEGVEAETKGVRRLLSPGRLVTTGALVTAAAVGLAVLPVRHAEEPGAGAAMRALPPATDFSPARADRIARDNRMLAEIDQALASGDEAPADLSQGSRQGRRPRTHLAD